MTCPDHQKIVTAFTVGYFTTFLKDQLMGQNTSTSDFIHGFFIKQKEQIKETIFKLYESLFDVQYGNCFFENCIEEIKESIDKVIAAISEKLQKEDQSFLELAFYCGSFLSVANSVHPKQYDQKKFQEICSELLSSLKVNISWLEFKEIFKGLNASTNNENCTSREELFAAIANSNSNYHKVLEFQSTIYDLTYQNAYLLIYEASKFIS